MVHLSFQAVHEVGNTGIFVQLQIKINWKQLRLKSFSKQIDLCPDALKIELIFKFKQYKNAKLLILYFGLMCIALTIHY